MAEPVYKKITELDVLSTAIDGSETLPIVKAGKTYRRTLANLFGTGWITSLLGAFTAFKAPDADHADDSDTVEGETAAQLHAASGLTGAIHLDRIPAELTGKNAATATVSASCSGNAATATLAADATKLTTARTIGGVSFDGSENINLPGVNATGNQNTSGRAAYAGIADRSYAVSNSVSATGPLPSIYDNIGRFHYVINTEKLYYGVATGVGSPFWVMLN